MKKKKILIVRRVEIRRSSTPSTKIAAYTSDTSSYFFQSETSERIHSTRKKSARRFGMLFEWTTYKMFKNVTIMYLLNTFLASFTLSLNISKQTSKLTLVLYDTRRCHDARRIQELIPSKSKYFCSSRNRRQMACVII